MSTSTAWSSRPVLAAMSPEQLARFVDRSIARAEGLLFTATPSEDLDEIGRWQQIRDQAFAGQCRAIVSAVNRASREQREFAADEVGLAVGATTTTGGLLVQTALAACALPGLLEAVETGLLTERHVLAVLRELERVELSLEQRQCVVLVALARFTGQAPGELARLVGRLVTQVDRAAAAARDVKATAARKVWFSRDVDGQAALMARGPAAMIAAIRASLEATLPVQADPEDERSRDAREFDLFVDLLTGGTAAGSWHAEVVVPFSVAEGGDLELAEIPGLGPLLPATARDLLSRCDTLAQTAVDQTGKVIAVGDPMRIRRPAPHPGPRSPAQPDRVVLEPIGLAERALSRPAATPIQARSPLFERLATPPPVGRALTGNGYRFPPRLRRFLEARDRTCVFPGCVRPARTTDKDHRIPWPTGATDTDNGPVLVPPAPPREACSVHRPARRRRQPRLDQPRRLGVPPTSPGLLTFVASPPPTPPARPRRSSASPAATACFRLSTPRCVFDQR